jgi:hypothetical protein
MAASDQLTPALLSLPFGELHGDGKVYLSQLGARFLQELLTDVNNPIPSVASAEPALTLRETDHSPVAWKPVLAGQTTAGVQTYGATTVGRTARIGPCVFAAFVVALTAVGGTIAGNVVINGLPFAANASGPTQAGALSEWSDVTLAASNTALGIQMAPGSSSISLVQSGSGIAATMLQATGIANTSLLVGSLTYFI